MHLRLLAVPATEDKRVRLIQTGIENASQFGVTPVDKDRVGFVDQQCRPISINRTIQRRHRDIGRMEGPIDQTTEDLEISCFATSLFGGADAQKASGGNRLD